MSNSLNRAPQIIATAASQLFKPGYMRAMAKTTLDWDFDHRPGAIPSVSVYDLIKQPYEVRLSIAPLHYGDSPPMDVMVLSTLVRMADPRTVFEFGTFTGLSTLCMAMNTSDETHIWTLDLPPDGGQESDAAHINSAWRDLPVASRITQVYADSTKLDVTPYAKKMDFIFVDANHDYEFVVSDSAKAFEMLAPGGMIVWHDYTRGFPGVQRCLDEIGRSKKLYHVQGTQLAFYREGQS